MRSFPFRSSRERTSSSNDSKRSGRSASIVNYLRCTCGFVRQTIAGHQRFTSCHLQCIEAPAGAAQSVLVRNAIAAALASGLVVAAFSVALAAAADTPRLAPESGVARARVQIRVYDATVMPAANQEVGLRAAAGVLAAAGID